MENVKEYEIGGVDAHVACADARFCRMLSLELERVGVKLSEYAGGNPPRLLLVDLDDYPSPASEMMAAELLVGWTRGDASKIMPVGFSAVLHRPFLTEELLSLVCELTGVGASVPRFERYVHTSKALILPTERQGVVSVGDKTVRLSPKEWLIFKRLYDGGGETVGREELVSLIDADGGAGSLEVHICHLRDKLEKPFGIKVFYTVRGVGYRMTAQ